MSIAPVSAAVPSALRWLSRIHAGLIAGAIWLGMTYLSGHAILGHAPTRPAVVLGGQPGAVLLLVGMVLLSVVGGLAAAPRGRRDGVRPLAVVAIGWALWATGGGSIDDWLIDRNPIPGPPQAAPYWALLPDYVVLGVLIVFVLLISAWLMDRSIAGKPVAALRTMLPLDAKAEERRAGPLALLITIVLACLLISFLMGPPLGKTRQGQVFFAVAAGFWIAVYVARQVTKVERAGWFWAAPLLVGLIGTILAALNPGHAPPYDQNNIIPARNLVRPLPIEMVSVGLLAIAWHFRERATQPDATGARSQS